MDSTVKNSGKSGLSHGEGNEDERQKKKGRLALNLFGLAFLLAGLAVIVFSPLSTLYEHFTSAGWQRVPATLEHIELRTHYGDDSTTWSVETRYRYRFNGRDYMGDRAGYDTGSDNIGDYHSNLVYRMKRAGQQGPVNIWVNPNDPAQSLLVRELRCDKLFFTVLFGGLFVAVGVGIMLLGRIRNRGKVNGEDVIFSSERHGHWLFAFMAIMFLGMSLPGVLAIPKEVDQDNWLVLLVLVFPLAGLWLARMAWTTRRNWRYYGPVPLVLDPSPGQVGGDIGGRIRLSRPDVDVPWQVTLQCVRVRTSSGKNSRRSESIIWQEQQTPHAYNEGTGAVVSFCFCPPTDLPATDASGRNRVLWRVIIDGPQKPVPLERTYQVPVERGTNTSVVTLPKEHIERAARKAEVEAASAAAEQIDVEPFGAGMLIRSRAGRNPGMTLALLVAGIAFSGGSVGLFIAAAEEGVMLYLMSLVFGLFGFPMAVGALFMAGRSLEAKVANNRVQTVRYWCGLALWKRQGALQSRDQLVLTNAGSMTQGHRMTEFFHLDVKSGDKKIRVAEGLAGREVAEAMRDNLARMLRLE
ncbi:hypothetical protein RE428_32920 [Marinobacter nanhaiticus D15-8W]|nr:DUF3592 domain-containing protein [Marinobacter nanhaiticus]BES72274.1 hypothetical protein RE428_32920 [Marinobacter nanhaiticus D15-8W]